MRVRPFASGEGVYVCTIKCSMHRGGGFLLAIINQRKERQQVGKRRRSRSNSVPNIVFKTEAGVKCATDSSPWKRWLESETPRDVLGSALDWKLQFDVHAPEMGQTKNETFPCEILPGVEQRPDGLIWSRSAKIVIWLELTSPWEENMELRHYEKLERYNKLAIDCKDRGWQVYPLCVEVGCRGYVWPAGWTRVCETFGLSNNERKRLKWRVEQTAQHCSHTIYAHRYQREWHGRSPLDVSEWCD